MSAFAARVLHAALLDVDTYEEVEADAGANLQALAVVVLAALAMGIGSIENSGASGILWHTIVSVAGWYVWAFVTYVIGTRLLPTGETVADHGELLRTIGFSSGPGILRVLMIFPPLSLWIFAICSLWMLVAMIVAVRQALDYTSTPRAVGVCLIGWLVQAVILIFSAQLFGLVQTEPI
jgi:hypothetical protein